MATEITNPMAVRTALPFPRQDHRGRRDSRDIRANAPGGLRVIRRNGKVTNFDANKIAVARPKAFLAVEGGSAAASRRVHDLVRPHRTTQRRPVPTQSGRRDHPLEDIQDQVEAVADALR